MKNSSEQSSREEVTVNDAAWKKWLILLAFVLFSILLMGGFYLFTTPGQTVNLAFAYVTGLSMIVLPCTLPLAFVIVPMAMGKSPQKGLLMALFFGLGLAIMLSLYGVFVAFVGDIMGLDQAIAEAGVVSRMLFIIGGAAAFLFGLSELGLVRVRIPSFSGAYPEFIQKQQDYIKALLLGLFLGNAGVGCPNPLFYVLLGDIALVASVPHGWWLGFIHGIGRATPLVFLALLGILGVNAVSGVASKAALVKKVTGVTLVILGAFIFISGTSHQWYERTVLHRGWNQVVEYLAGEKIAERGEHEHIPGTPEDHGHEREEVEEDDHAHSPDLIPEPWSWIVLLLMISLPLSWWGFRKEQE